MRHTHRTLVVSIGIVGLLLSGSGKAAAPDSEISRGTLETQARRLLRLASIGRMASRWPAAHSRTSSIATGGPLP
jgi:hypothetical protein